MLAVTLERRIKTKLSMLKRRSPGAMADNFKLMWKIKIKQSVGDLPT